MVTIQSLKFVWFESLTYDQYQIILEYNHTKIEIKTAMVSFSYIITMDECQITYSCSKQLDYISFAHINI